MTAQPRREAQVRVRIKGTRVYVPDLRAQFSESPFHVPGSSDPAYRSAAQGRRAHHWGAAPSGPNRSLEWSHGTLVNRSWQAYRNHLLAGSLVEKLVSNVVGTGIEPVSIAPLRGYRRRVQALFATWTDEADYDGRTDFYGLQELIVRGMITGADMFVRLHIRPLDSGLAVPLQLQVLEGAHCPTDLTRQEANGNTIRAGIEFDPSGRRVAYWLYPEHPADRTGLFPTDFQPKRIPAEEIIHIYRPLRGGQIRGEPWLSRSLPKLYDLDRYDDSELARKNATSNFAGFIKRPSPEGAIMTEDDSERAQQAGHSVATVEPGTMQVLYDGEDIIWSEPAEAGSDYPQYMRWQAMLIAAGAGVLYEQLTGDYEHLNDRTLRAAMLEFRRNIEMIQHHCVAFSFCRPTWLRWLPIAVASGALEVPPSLDERDARAVKWVPPAWPYIHPVQEVDAREREVRAGFESRTNIVAERGYDAEQIDREQRDDNRRADQWGLAYTSDGRRARAIDSARAIESQPQDDEENDNAAR